MSKYELTEEVRELGGERLYRIRALVDFEEVSKGDLGGFIKSELNLDQHGSAWVSGDARVSDNAWVSDNALVYGNARVSDNALVYGNARIYGNARVSDNALVYGNAQIYGDARVSDNAQIYGNARVSGSARVSGNAKIYGDARVSGSACVSGDTRLICGTFSKSPLYIEGSRFAITVNSLDCIFVGRTCMSLSDWRAEHQHLAKKHNFTFYEIEEYHLYLNMIESYFKL